MRFDSSRAWSDAAQKVSANRDVLVALAGVFMVVPTFALAMFWPQPVPPPKASLEQLLELIGAHYREAWYAYLIAVVINLVGTLAMLALFTDRSRPTVGEAIRIGSAAAPVVILAQLLVGMGLALLVVIPASVAGATGNQVLVALAMIAAAGVVVWVWTRLSLLSPAVLVDSIRNPVVAIARSWQLTRGNAGRLLLFYALVAIAFFVSIMLVEMALGIIASLILPAAAQGAASNFVTSVLQAVMGVYFVAVIAASHRQLTGSDEGSVVNLLD